jgi:hypothetical protein
MLRLIDAWRAYFDGRWPSNSATAPMRDSLRVVWECGRFDPLSIHVQGHSSAGARPAR